MAISDISYPKIPDANWWKIRELFKQKVPTILSASYLASALSISELSAKSNLIGPLKKLGFIDLELKPTDLAYDWRDDAKYTAVCSKLLESNYPQEVRDLFHVPSDVDFTKLTSWFMNNARCGEPAAKMFARFYLLLLKADLAPAEVGGDKKDKEKVTKKKPSLSKTKPALVTQTQPDTEITQAEVSPNNVKRQNFNSPDLHINIC